MKTWDAIIIGAGHNGLVTACYLQRAGLDVLVVEKNDGIGWARTGRERHPGFPASGPSSIRTLPRPEIMHDLELQRFGLQVIPCEGSTVFTREKDYLATYRNRDSNRREISRFSARDAETYERFSRDIQRQYRFIAPLLMRTPPDPTSMRPRDIGEMLYLGRHFHDLSRNEIHDMIRFWTMSAADFLDQYFETDALKARLAIPGMIGAALGPMSPGTACTLLHRYMGGVDGAADIRSHARGGMGSVIIALAASFEASGGTLRVSAPIDHILIKDGKAVGVVLEGGEEIRASTVASGADAKRTFLGLVEDNELPEDFVRKVRNFRMRGSCGKVDIALDALPRFPALPDRSPCVRGVLHFTDSIERMEHAYDDWKHGRWSSDPVLDLTIPTTIDPSMTWPGDHFLSCFVQYCPARVEGSDWTEGEREKFGKAVVDQIAEYSSDFKSLIRHMEVRTPHELELEAGLTGGDLFQGELSFDQALFNRPVPGYAQYRSPVRGLYMCGASSHPGGGVTGAPGRNAAAEILRDRRRSRSDMSDAYAVL